MIQQKIQELRVWFSKQKFSKSGRNKHLNFAYMELIDFVPQLEEKLLSMGLCDHTTFAAATICVHTVFDIETGESMVWESPCVMAAMSNPIQSIGAMHTYMRRYMWTIALCISVPDEVDATESTKSAAGKDKLKTMKQEIEDALKSAETKEDCETVIKLIDDNKTALGIGAMKLRGEANKKLSDIKGVKS